MSQTLYSSNRKCFIAQTDDI
uniref:Uncharacterized protein n=1 Tax=Arundo donax TaxID=35708 RepID=A0A0A8XUD5_ARUDO